jgi:hypothetical protein
MTTSFVTSAGVLEQAATPDCDSETSSLMSTSRTTSPVFRGLMFALILESLIVAAVCASYFGCLRLLHR